MKIKIPAIYLILAIILILIPVFIVNYTKTNILTDEPIEIPVKVHLIQVEYGALGSERNRDGIIELFDEVNKIWSQAGIYFNPKEIVVENISYHIFQNAMVNLDVVASYTELDSNSINAYFMKSIGGPNGIAINNLGSIFIADKTTVNDFRATSHEFGHLLGLHHSPNPNSLMFQGGNGTLLSDFEIKTAIYDARLIS